MTDLLISALAAWYVAYVLTSTHGPFEIFQRLREWRGGYWHGRGKQMVSVTVTGAIGEHTSKYEYEPVKSGLLDCPVCLAFWAALLLLHVPDGVVLQALAVAGAAMLLHGFTGWRFN